MKRIALFLFGLLFVFSVFAQHTLSLMTYNVRNANGMDGVHHCQRIANVIVQADPDVVAIQEVDSVTKRSHDTYVLGEIAAHCNMHAYFAPAIDFDGGKYGIGILAKQKPIRLQQVSLPGKEEKRALLLAEFDNFIFCCTHLSLTEADRLQSLKIIKQLQQSADKPFFVAGDLNDHPQSEFIRGLQQEMQLLSSTDQPTYPAPNPTETIDYIAVSKSSAKDMVVTSLKVLNEPVASDHRPVCLRLRMAEKPERVAGRGK